MIDIFNTPPSMGLRSIIALPTISKSNDVYDNILQTIKLNFIFEN